MIDKELFEKCWLDSSSISKDTFDKDFITLPCRCGSVECDGFGVYSRNPLAIKAYFDMYAPKSKLSKDELITILGYAKQYDEKYSGTFAQEVISVSEMIHKHPESDL